MSSSKFKLKHRNAGGAPGFVPATLVAPVILGTATVDGTSLSFYSKGTYTNSPTGLAVQWMRNGVDIAGATGDTYLKVIGDLTTNITARVTPSNAIGAGTAAVSNSIGPISSSPSLTDVAPLTTPVFFAGVAGSVQLTGNMADTVLTLTANPGSAYSLVQAGNTWFLKWSTAIVQRTDTVTIRQTPGFGAYKDTTFTFVVGASSQTPVLQAYTRNFGALTRTTSSHVRLRELMLAPGSPPAATWTIGAASTGVAGHWTLPTAGVSEGTNAVTPKPSSAGVTAGLSSGTYVHAIFCTGADGSTSNTVNLTTVTVANAVSVGDLDILPDNVYTPANILGMTVAAFQALNSNAPKSILLSAGMNQESVRWGGMTDFTFTAQVEVRWADARVGKFTQFNQNNCTFLKFTGIALTGNFATSGNGLWLFTDCYDIVMNDCAAVGPGLAAWLGRVADGSAYAFTLKNTNARFTINNFVAMYVHGGINVASVLTQTDFTWNSFYCRYFSDNAVFWAYVTNWSFYDMVTASPTRWHTDGGHIDHVQGQDSSLCTNLIICRYVLIDADGDAYAGTIFGVVGTYTFQNIIILTRGNQGLYLNGVPSGSALLDRITMIKAMGVNVNTEIQEGLDIDDGGSPTYNPDLLLRNTNTQFGGSLTARSMFIYDSITYLTNGGSAGTKPATFTIEATVKNAGIGSSGGGSNPQSDILYYYPINVRAVYDTITDAEWKAAGRQGLTNKALDLCKPLVGGRLDAGGGVDIGAVTRAGAWN